MVPVARRTLGVPTALAGFGLHGGRPVRAVLRPAALGAGLRWEGAPVGLHQVSAPGGATVWTAGDRRLSTIEHLMAALHLRGLTDLELEVEGDELPVLDGSAWAWWRALGQAGARSGAAVVPRRPKRAIQIEQGSSAARWRPEGPTRVSVEVDFGPGRRGSAEWRPGDPPLPLLAARTFVPAEWADRWRAEGRGSAAHAGNTVVWGESPLAWPDEPVAHKLLDALGDLWLVGPVAGAIELVRPTHALTLALLKEADAAGWHG